MEGQTKLRKGGEVVLGTGMATALAGHATLLKPSSTKPLDLFAPLFL